MSDKKLQSQINCLFYSQFIFEDVEPCVAMVAGRVYGISVYLFLILSDWRPQYTRLYFNREFSGLRKENEDSDL